MNEHKIHPEKSGDIIKQDNNGFYTVKDEDISKYGTSIPHEIEGGVSGHLFCKSFSTLSLHLAASHRQVKSMQHLLLAGADTETRDQLGQTPLHLLITNWPKTVSKKTDSRFQTAVAGMCQQAQTCLRLLCEHSFNINAEVDGKSHQTALHISVSCRALSAVQILASYGANVNAVDSNGMTPLHMAAGILHKDIITTLVRYGADINMGLKHSGNTPLHLAVVAITLKNTKKTTDDINCITELLEHGAEPNSTNKAGMTPLQEACSMGNNEIVELLLQYGANINKLTKTGENCLFLFLNHKLNMRNTSLLVKLLSLTSPFTVYNHNGHLPSTLRLPCFFKQRDQLLKLMWQPRRLQDICKRYIYLKHIQRKPEELRKVLPESLYDFVFNCWKNVHISFETNDGLTTTPS